MSHYYLVILYGIPALLSGSVGVAVWRRRASELDVYLAFLMFATTAWSLGYTLELASQGVFFYWLWGLVQYVGIACAPILFFILMVHYVGLEARLTRRLSCLLWTVPVLSIVFRITDPLHGLVHRSTAIEHLNGFSYQIHQAGPWFWVTIAYSYLMLWGGVLILLYYRSSARLVHRRHMTLLTLGTLAPLFGSLAYIVGLRPLGFVDLTPMGFTFTAIAVAWGALAHRFLEVMPVARTALVDGFPDGLLMLDKHGRVLDMNATAGHMLHLDVNQCIGKCIGEILARWPELLTLCGKDTEGRVEFPVSARSSTEPAPEAGTSYEGRLSFLRQYKDEVSACLLVITDVTDRKRAEELLHKSQALYHDLVETARDLIWQCDSEGRFTYLNPAWENSLGYRVNDMLGKRFADFESPQEGAGVSRLIEDASPQEYETLLLGDGDRKAYLIVKGKCVYDGDGALIGTRGTAHDITARKRVEEQLRQAMKMEAVGRLAGGVAHDFNNLLQVINGNNELALYQVPEEHPARRFLEQVGKAGDRAAILIKQLLAFGRRQVIQPEFLNLNEVINVFLGIMHGVIGEHIGIKLLPCASLGSIFADRGQLEQVIMNLSVNARDAMPEGGVLTIETANVTFDPLFCAINPWAKPGDFVCLTFADTGSGINNTALDQIWEPFYTTKPAGKGTGLGLATVYGIVQQHEGFIRVTSQPGQGALFSVYFPKREGVANPIKIVSQATPTGGTETILLAEDEGTVRVLACRLLEDAGYKVHAAENGHDAVRLAQEHDGKVDLALLDVVMPVMGGRAAYEQLKAMYPGMRFLFVSGYTGDMVDTNFFMNEGLELVHKPFNRNSLLEKVRKLLDGKQLGGSQEQRT